MPQPLLTHTLVQMLSDLGHIAVAPGPTIIQLPHNNLVLTPTGHKVLITQPVTHTNLLLEIQAGSAAPEATSPQILEIPDPEFQEKLLTIINSNC